MSVTFCHIEPTDRNEILGMMEKFYAIDGYPFDPNRAEALLTEFIASAHKGGIWKIDFDGTLAGYLIITSIFSFEYGGWIGFLDELYIRPEFRGKGIGSLAVDFTKEKALQDNLKLVYLEVEPHNETAKKLYLSRGFSEHKRQLMAYKPKHTND